MRLINADKLIDFIDAGHLRSRFEPCFSEDDVVKMIENQPTAFDVEKVADILEQCGDKCFDYVLSDKCKDEKCSCMAIAIAYNTAAEIVRKG